MRLEIPAYGDAAASICRLPSSKQCDVQVGLKQALHTIMASPETLQPVALRIGLSWAIVKRGMLRSAVSQSP